MSNEPQIRRPSGCEIRNAEGLYWDDQEKRWSSIGTRWQGFRRRDMLRKARTVGGKLVRLTLVRRSRTGRTAVRCEECCIHVHANTRLRKALRDVHEKVSNLNPVDDAAGAVKKQLIRLLRDALAGDA